ncbi:hypothetical protein H6B14_01960 [Phocaeicola coprophilus]|nr:hypothetical protein [Phocaeicola coprophilus]
MSSQISSVTLPLWLDDYIFNRLGATYCCSRSNMSVIDWNNVDVLNYLGTYFPRSFVESYSIFTSFLKKHAVIYDCKKELSIFDFGCGTGGEIIGLLLALSEQCKSLKHVIIRAHDGNFHALRLFESILHESRSYIQIPQIETRIFPLEIEDFYDLSILEEVLSCKFDIILSFKAICEFVTKERFEQSNPYKHVADLFLQKLEDDGVMLLADVTVYNDVSQEWLPHMMDVGLQQVFCNVIAQNEGYNQSFRVFHSRKRMDVSKIAWRIINRSR